MDVLIVTTESHRRLADSFFRPTLPTPNGAVIFERRLDVVSEGDDDSESWQRGVTAKLGWALDYLGSLPDNASFVLSDVDIQFFPGFSTCRRRRRDRPCSGWECRNVRQAAHVARVKIKDR